VLDEARETERRHAWDGPPGHNFKELTDLALAKWPQSAAVHDLRREAADSLLADALGRKYANDLAEALHLVRIALELNPDLTAAQHLAAELTGPKPLDVAPVASTTLPSSDRAMKVPRRFRDGKPREPRPAASAPTASASASPAPPQETAPHEANPRPSSSSSGPWL
jgi:hypothetical protein